LCGSSEVARGFDSAVEVEDPELRRVYVAQRGIAIIEPLIKE
jgi:hypothetical protein